MLDPRDGAVAALPEVGEDGGLLGGRELGAELVVDERHFPPEAEVGLVVVIDVGGADDGPGFPVGREMPRGGAEEEVLGLGQVFFLTGDDPAECGGFGDG